MYKKQDCRKISKGTNNIRNTLEKQWITQFWNVPLVQQKTTAARKLKKNAPNMNSNTLWSWQRNERRGGKSFGITWIKRSRAVGKRGKIYIYFITFKAIFLISFDSLMLPFLTTFLLKNLDFSFVVIIIIFFSLLLIIFSYSSSWFFSSGENKSR